MTLVKFCPYFGSPLMDIDDSLKELNLPVVLITDKGLTEFNEPINTCIAIDPDYSEKLMRLLGILKFPNY